VISRRGFARLATTATHAIVVGAVLIVMARFRFGDEWVSIWGGIIPSPLLAALAYVVFALGIFTLAGLYRSDERWSVQNVVKDVTRAVAILALATMALLFFFDLDRVSRRYVFYVFVVLWLAMILGSIGLRQAFAWARRSGYAIRHVVVVGAGPDASRVVHDLTTEHPELGIHIVGYLGPPEARLDGYERLGDTEDLPEVLTRSVVDEVVVCLPMDEWSEIDSVVRYAEQQGKPVRVPLPVMDYTMAHSRVDQIGGAPVLTLVVGPDQALGLAAKRGLDVVLAALGMLLLTPLFLAAAVTIWISEGRPIFFTQIRAGLHGRPFPVVKFRTMINGAESQRAALEDLNERTGPVFKIAEDPRVTTVGSFLRKTSIDELPQLWNVLTGDMSLVGPRPPILDEVDEYDLRHRRRLSMKPGLTGLWQVSARDDPNFERWVQLDLEYIDNWSLMADLGLLARTPFALIRRPGR
jgi:exopolysaccharide biosynthesis polyprenyl glycosylphosphotransferase